MPTYTWDMLRRLWVYNGGPAEQADNAAAVAIAESDGNPDARDPEHGTYENGSFDSGLWQINGYASLTDPNKNARRAVAMWHERGWEPWCTAWTDGACGTKGGRSSNRNSLVPGSPAANALHEHVHGTPPPSHDWTETLIMSLPTLHKGISSTDVRRVQGLLTADGHGVQIDGVFGPGTDKAVREAQKLYGIADDGIVGKDTWTALLTGKA